MQSPKHRTTARRSITRYHLSSFISAKIQTDAKNLQFDWEYAQTPEQSSLIAAAWVNFISPFKKLQEINLYQGNNFTYNTDQGGFSEDNDMSIDQRGFKALIQLEAEEFLTPSQLKLNSVVKTINNTNTGVIVTLTSGETFKADYALSTFSLGVLQNEDVIFEPKLPGE